MGKCNDISAGLLMYDIIDNEYKILLCHSGGPYFQNEIKHPRMWGIPKGLMEAGENILKCAIREFEEETSIKAGSNFQSLGSVVYKNGKTVHALTFKGTFPGKITSNFFTIEWPPSSGVMKSFPEIDRGEMYTLSEARKKIMVSQEAFIDKFEELIKTKVI